MTVSRCGSARASSSSCRPRRAARWPSITRRRWSRTSVTTWSLRLRAVWSLAAGAPHELGQAALDRHVDVFVVVAGHEGARLDLAGHPGEAVLDRPQVGGGETPARRSARACAADPSMSSGHSRQSSASDEFRATNAAERSPANRPDRALLIVPPSRPASGAVSRPLTRRAGTARARRPRHHAGSRRTGCSSRRARLHELDGLLADPRPDLDRQAPQLDEAGRRLVRELVLGRVGRELVAVQRVVASGGRRPRSRPCRTGAGRRR